MGIVFGKNAPINARRIIANHISQNRQSATIKSLADSAGAEGGDISEGYRSYDIGIENLDKEELLSAVKEGNWTYLVHDGAGGSPSEIDIIEEKGETRVLATRLAPSGKGTIRSLLEAEKHKYIAEKDYELRLLRCPGIHFISLWFHSDDDDIIMPIPPDMTGLKHYKAYSEREVSEVLKELASGIIGKELGELGG